MVVQMRFNDTSLFFIYFQFSVVRRDPYNPNNNYDKNVARRIISVAVMTQQTMSLGEEAADRPPALASWGNYYTYRPDPDRDPLQSHKDEEILAKSRLLLFISTVITTAIVLSVARRP